MFNKKLKIKIEVLSEAQNGLLRDVKALRKELTRVSKESALNKKVLLKMLERR